MSDSQVWCDGGLLFSIKDLQVPWDPGGTEIFHRLGGKPKLKKGGMSVYTLGLLTVAAHMKLVTHIAADTNLNSDMLVTTKLTNVMLSSRHIIFHGIQEVQSWFCALFSGSV